nr:uncharacterized protein LOC111846107 isoform X1 [Paramormyrops kingsleyae]
MELESEVINAYLRLLVQRCNKEKGHKAALIDSYAMTAMWDRKLSRLRVLYPHEKRCLFLDPLGEKAADLRRCQETTRAFMRQKGYRSSRWSCGTLPHSLQRDAVSCGVLALKFAEKKFNGDNLTFDASEKQINKMRLDIATTLLQESDDLSGVCYYCVSEEGDTLWICCDSCERWFHVSCVQHPSVDEDSTLSAALEKRLCL